MLIELKEHPAEAQVVLHLGKLTHTGNRALRYINLYKIYESLCGSPDVDFSSIRHALAHAPHMLSKHRTIESLERQFGTVHLDLADSVHLTKFWRKLGELLVEVDTLAGNALGNVIEGSLFKAHYADITTHYAARYYFPDQYREVVV